MKKKFKKWWRKVKKLVSNYFRVELGHVEDGLFDELFHEQR